LVLVGGAVLLPWGAGAETIDVGNGLSIQMDIPPGRWQVYRQPPAFLVAEIAEHLEHELAAQGKPAGAEAVRRAAEKRLAANEAFVCNPASGACLTIDFSPLRPDEDAPGGRAVALSARYAGEGLADEEGVTGLEQRNGKVSVPGAEAASRVDARYQLHGEPRQFIGIIGFLQPSWFFLYYSDPLRDAGDFPEMEKILKSAALQRPKKD
jgi:hypothetical protein